MLTYCLLFWFFFFLFIAYKADKYYQEIEAKDRQKKLEEAELTIEDFINQ